MDYQLELKQIVDYPRCRIYREFIRSLMEDRDIRTNGSSYLFYYMTLCSYANFRSSYRRIEGISYLVGPGEWICKTSELAEWFRTRYQRQALSILDFLQKQNYITYIQLGRNNLVKFSITGWKQHNTALDYNYPCLKDVGFSGKKKFRIHYHNIITGVAAFAYFFTLQTSQVLANQDPASDMWSKAETIMQDVYGKILGISTIAAIVTASIALLLMNFSKSGKTVDESRA